jgi:hypothetical protein
MDFYLEYFDIKMIDKIQYIIKLPTESLVKKQNLLNLAHLVLYLTLSPDT